MLSGLVILLMAVLSTLSAALQTPDELHNQYYTIFPSGNRNAASHRWATYVLERSNEMTETTLRNLLSSFCAVSGSPVYASAAKRWKMTLPLVGTGEEITGMMYFCCAPCVCDTQEFIKVDTKTITTADGPKRYYFTVIGNPCFDSEALTQTWQDPFSGSMVSLQQTAPDVKCSGTELEKAMLSDHGHIIIGMFFENDVPNHATSDVGFNDSEEAKGYCEQRAENGYQSGMGEIFRKVALITPVSNWGWDASSNEVTQGSSIMWSDSETTTASISSITSPTTSTSTSTTSTTSSSTASSQSSVGDQNATTETSASSSSSTASSDDDPGTASPSTTASTTKSNSNMQTSNDGTPIAASKGLKIAGSPMMFICFLAVELITMRT